MNLDGITLHCITNELADILKGGQISKIYQLDARSLYFRIFNDQASICNHHPGRLAAPVRRRYHAADAGYPDRPLHVPAQIL